MSRLIRLATRLPARWRRALRRLPGFDRLRAAVLARPRLPGPAPGDLRPVVYVPPWPHLLRQRPHYLVSAFAAAGHPAYLVDHQVTGSRVEDGVTVVGSLRDVPRSGVILYLHFAPMRHLIDRFPDAVVIYDIPDDLSIYDPDETGLPERRRARSHHPHLMKRADVVTVSNPVLADRHGEERPDLLLVSNGVDPARFGGHAARPGDLPPPDPERPIIGYHGMISTWFDFELLEAVMERRPHWRFVLVGPVDPEVSAVMDSLRRRGNLTLVGPRPSEAMPGYVQGFDVGVIWFEVNRMTEGVTPLKMYECLAAGVPCVATPLPACVKEPLVETAASPDGMVAAIERALDADRERLRAGAEDHSWARNLQPLLDRLDESGKRRVPP